MFFYYGDIVDAHYIMSVDEMTSVGVHDNPLWFRLLPVNDNSVLEYFQETGVADGP